MAVPVEFEKYVRKFRRFIKDEADKNDLLEAEENTDEFLYECIVDTIEEINYVYEPQSSYVITDLPWIIVRSGATLQYLTGAGIHSARNTFQYNDGSSINVNDTDTFGRYINYYNILINKYRDMVTAYKKRKNIDNCYGGTYSQYNELWGG